MKRIYLAFAAAVVLVAVIGLVIQLRSDDAPATTARAPAAADPGRLRRAPVPASPHPDTGQSEHTSAPPVIHDHRAPEPAASEPAPSETPAPARPPQPDRAAATQITQVLSQRLPAALQECAANLQPAQHGARSRIEGEIRIAIKDHQATITSAAFQLRDVIDAVQNEIKQCLVQHAVGVTAPAGDEADIDSRAINVSLRWP